MPSWSKSEQQAIEKTDDLRLAPFRDDGATYGIPTWVWSVVVGGELYVRAYNGRASRWYNAARRQTAGRITVAGMTKEVAFETGADTPEDAIDLAYREKYHGSPYLEAMIGKRARSATVRVTPR